MDWLAQLVTHIPNKGEQLVRYYGYYSNKSRGLRKKTAAGDDLVPALIEAEISAEEFRRNWARLIQKVYHADPLLCPKCSEPMPIISFIENEMTYRLELRRSRVRYVGEVESSVDGTLCTNCTCVWKYITKHHMC